jgi:hypothetical protein
MAKKAIKLNEAQLRNMIAKSIRRAIKEEYDGLDPVGEKVWGDYQADARANGEAQAAWQYLQSCSQALNELKSHFKASREIINKIDSTEFGHYSDDVDDFLAELYNFLEENEHRIERFSRGEFLLKGGFDI